ncbi:MAG TPA: hypothetical protein VE715_13195 [Blastocatellia bacterium]|nr:hypothetical protein [Blastocatellia bacterium]
MNPIAIGLIVFAFVFGGALFGIFMRAALPEDHLSNESKDTVKLGTGLIATMTALVLGLMTASAKSSFDVQDTLVNNAAADILTLDRILARYGPETKEIRDSIRRIVAIRLNEIWPADRSQPVRMDPSTVAPEVEGIGDRIRALSPHDEAQWRLQRRALDIYEGLLKSRWFLFRGVSVSTIVPFLVALVFWLTITFMSFGLFAPRNATVIAVIFLCALSVSSVVFLILEMDNPFEGVIKVSDAPVRYALSHLGQ